MTVTAQTLPFGKHKGVPLCDVPDTYLTWVLRQCKLSSGLRTAVAEQLHARGIEPPEPAPPAEPTCPRCGPAAGHRYHWQVDSLKRRHIKRTCTGCGQWQGFAPAVPPFTEQADLADLAEPRRPK
jgi:hypothetical protein